MATVYQVLSPDEAQFLSSAFPQIIKNGTNVPTSALSYDASADYEDAFWKIFLMNYAAGTITVDLYWYAANATTGQVQWEVAMAAYTPETDTEDVEATTAVGSEVAAGYDTHLGTTSKRIHKYTLSLDNANKRDNAANNDIAWIRIRRDGNHASDTMANDAVLVMAVLSYSDT